MSTAHGPAPEETPGDTPVGPPGPAPVVNRAALVFDDPLDRPSADDTDRGWGEQAGGPADDDFTRFLNEKPPHHL